jgi:hypothetical protein
MSDKPSSSDGDDLMDLMEPPSSVSPAASPVAKPKPTAAATKPPPAAAAKPPPAETTKPPAAKPAAKPAAAAKPSLKPLEKLAPLKFTPKPKPESKPSLKPMPKAEAKPAAKRELKPKLEPTNKRLLQMPEISDQEEDDEEMVASAGSDDEEDDDDDDDEEENGGTPAGKNGMSHAHSNFPQRPRKKIKSNYEMFRRDHKKEYKNYHIARWLAGDGISYRRNKSHKGMSKDDVIAQRKAEVEKGIAELQQNDFEKLDKLREMYKLSDANYKKYSSEIEAAQQKHDEMFPQALKDEKIVQQGTRRHNDLTKDKSLEGCTKLVNVSAVLHEMTCSMVRMVNKHESEVLELFDHFHNRILKETGNVVTLGPKAAAKKAKECTELVAVGEVR